jgi:hypothetical protein
VLFSDLLLIFNWTCILFYFHKLASPQLYACFRYPRTLYLLHLVAMHHDGRAFVRLLWQEPDFSAQINSICSPLNVGATCLVVPFDLITITCTEIFLATTSPHLSAPPKTHSMHHSLASASSSTCECHGVFGSSVKHADCLYARRDLSGNALLQELPSSVFSANPNLYNLYENKHSCLTCRIFHHVIHL